MSKEETRVKIRVWRRALGRVDVIDLETYLTHVLPNEIYPSWPEEALKANAIMARTWAYYYMQNPKYPHIGADVCDTTSSQVYNPNRISPRTTKAVVDTAGFIMVDLESFKVFPTFYSASCGGFGDTLWNSTNLVGHTDCPCEDHGHKRSGHGHGGCQWGTNYLAKEGNSFIEILEFYFKDFVIVPNYGLYDEYEDRLRLLEARMDDIEALVSSL